MPTWFRRTCGILSLGGGAIGAAVVLSQLSAAFAPIRWGSALLYAIALLLFVLGMVAGLLVLEQNRLGTLLSIAYWAIQVPAFSSPWFTFQLVSGAQLGVIFGNGGLHFTATAGSQINFFFFNDQLPLAVGINILALVILALLCAWWRLDVADRELHDEALLQPGG